jgi:hypothetical protein
MTLACSWVLVALLFQIFPVFALDSTFDLKLTPSVAGQGAGMGSSTAIGDVNNDGYDDLFVGERDGENGAVYFYDGTSTGISATPSVTLSGIDSGDQFGTAIAIGDVNNDGYDDFAISSTAYNPGAAPGTGRAYVFFGGSSFDSTADVTMTGEAAQDFFGSAISIGDVNNDTYNDVIIGASGYSSNTGRVYVYYGGSSMDNTVDVTITGEASGDFFGASLDAEGDVNNDGYDDVIVASNQYSSNAGRAYVFLGGSSMDNTADVTMGGTADSRFGLSVSGAGDVNNDGYDDVIVGSPFYDVPGFLGIPLNNEIGRAYVFFGGSSMDNSPDVTMLGEISNDHFGTVVAPAGDLDADGYDDVLVGAEAYPGGGYDGRVYLFNGGSSMDENADAFFDAEQSSDDFAGYTTPIDTGDVNGDSGRDVVIGAPGASGGNYDGAAYLYYGTERLPPSVSTLSPADNATDVSTTANLVITFDEAVQGGTGTIILKKTSDNSIVETITTTGGLLSGSGTTTITIDPSTTLADGTSYYVTIHANTFRDAAGNFFAGISSATAWDFETAAAVAASSSSSSSASVSAEEQQGGGGGRGAGTAERNAAETFHTDRPAQTEVDTIIPQSPEDIILDHLEDRLMRRFLQNDALVDTIQGYRQRIEYVKQMFVRRMQRLRLRLQHQMQQGQR